MARLPWVMVLAVLGFAAACDTRSAGADSGAGRAKGEEDLGWCSRTSRLAIRACRSEAKADYLLARGRCEGLASSAGPQKAGFSPGRWSSPTTSPD